MSRAIEESNRRMLRARDAMDRSYSEPLDVAALARIACVSEAHFSQSPLAYRRSSAPAPGAVPTCFTMAWVHPSSFGEADRPGPWVKSAP